MKFLKQIFFLCAIALSSQLFSAASTPLEDFQALYGEQQGTTKQLTEAFEKLSDEDKNKDTLQELLEQAIEFEHQAGVEFLLTKGCTIAHNSIKQYQDFKNKEFLNWLITQCNFEFKLLAENILKIIIKAFEKKLFDLEEVTALIKNIVNQNEMIKKQISSLQSIKESCSYNQLQKNHLYKISIMYNIENVAKFWELFSQNCVIIQFLVEHYFNTIDTKNLKNIFIFLSGNKDQFNDEDDERKDLEQLQMILDNIPEEEKKSALSQSLTAAITSGSNIIIHFILSNDVQISNEILLAAINNNYTKEKSTELLYQLLEKKLTEPPSHDFVNLLINCQYPINIFEKLIDHGFKPDETNIENAFLNYKESNAYFFKDLIEFFVKHSAKPSEKILRIVQKKDKYLFSFFIAHGSSTPEPISDKKADASQKHKTNRSITPLTQESPNISSPEDDVIDASSQSSQQKAKRGTFVSFIIPFNFLNVIYDYVHFKNKNEKSDKTKKQKNKSKIKEKTFVTTESQTSKTDLSETSKGKIEKQELKIKQYLKHLYNSPMKHKKIYAGLLLSIFGYVSI